MSPRQAPLLLALLAAALAPGTATGQEEEPLFGEIRSVMDGVYTGAQADGGRMTFDTICSECHVRENFVGRAFLGVWADQPLYALWQFVTTRMPFTAPGSLAPDKYAEVLAYILRMNGYPEGDAPLPHEPLDVAGIDMVLPPDSQRPQER